MSWHEQPMIITECDGCGKTVTDDVGEMPMSWYTGNARHKVPSGADEAGDWDACSQKCIVKAIRKAVKLDG